VSRYRGAVTHTSGRARRTRARSNEGVKGWRERTVGQLSDYKMTEKMVKETGDKQSRDRVEVAKS
jgi:hypothetical protein